MINKTNHLASGLLGFSLSLLSPACGEDASPGGVDGSIAADARVALDASPGLDAAPGATLFALGSDGPGSGILSAVALPGLEVDQDLLASVASSDAVVRSFGGDLYIVNRFGSDNLTIVDPTVPELVAQMSTGAGSNPQDVAVAGSKIYVCPLNAGEILVLDLANPRSAPTSIDISSYDSDGVPNCASIVEAEDMLYASLELLDDTFTSQGGIVLAIDPSTDVVTGDVDLSYNNPFGHMIATDPDGAFGGDLLVATTDFSGTQGCIEALATGSTPSSRGCLVENEALGGYPSSMEVHGDLLWVAIATSFTTGEVVTVDADGSVGAALTPERRNTTDLAVCPTGHVITADQASGGLFAYDAEGRSLSTSPIDIGLPPAYAGGLVCL